MLTSIFPKREPLVGLDIGASGLKLVQLDLSRTTPVLKAIGMALTPVGAIEGSVVKDPGKLSQAISQLLEGSRCSGKNVGIAMPSSSVFTKIIKVPVMSLRELREQVRFESAEYIPYDIRSVAMDFHILGKSDPDSLEVLVVAVKTEVLEGYTEAVRRAGREVSVIDVDSFAMQNCFEFSEPALVAKTTALIDVGARFSSINIVRAGRSLCLGDVSAGTHLLHNDTSWGVESLEPTVSPSMVNPASTGGQEQPVCIRPEVRSLASELDKQISLLCGSCDEELELEAVRLCGGGSGIHDLRAVLAESLELQVDLIQPMSNIIVPDNLVSAHSGKSSALMGVATGLALRSPGDHIIPEFLE